MQSLMAAQFDRYQQIMRWLLRDSLVRYWKRVGVIFLLDGIATACQVGAAGLLFLYVRHIEIGSAFVLAGRTWEPRQSFPLLIAVAAAVLALFVGSSLLRYWTRSQSIRLIRQYEEFCIKRVVVTLSNLPVDAWPAHSMLFDRPTLSLLVQKDSRDCAIALRVLVNSIMPLVILLAASLALIYLDWTLFLLICLLLVLSARSMVRINLRAADYSRAFERDTPQAATEKLSLVDRGMQSPTEITLDDADFERVFASGKSSDSLDAYEGRFRVIEQSKLVNNLLIGFANFAAIGLIGWNVINGQDGWSIVIIYIVALRYCMSSVQQLAVGLTNLSRFYPQIRRYFSLVNAVPPQSSEADFPTESSLVVMVPPLHETPAAANFRPGMRVGLFVSGPPNRFTPGLMQGALQTEPPGCESSIILGARTVTWAFKPGSATLRQAYALPPESDEEWIAKHFAALGLADVATPLLAGGLDAPFRGKTDDKTAQSAFFVLGILAAAESSNPMVLAEGRGLARLPSKARTRLLQLLNSKIVVVVLRDDDKAMDVRGLEFVLVSTADIVSGWARPDWFIENLEQLRTATKSSQGHRDGQADTKTVTEDVVQFG